MRIGDNCWVFVNSAGKNSVKKLAIGWIILRDKHRFRVRVKNKIYTKTFAEIAKISPKDEELIKKELKKY